MCLPVGVKKQNKNNNLWKLVLFHHLSSQGSNSGIKLSLSGLAASIFIHRATSSVDLSYFYYYFLMYLSAVFACMRA